MNPVVRPEGTSNYSVGGHGYVAGNRILKCDVFITITILLPGSVPRFASRLTNFGIVPLGYIFVFEHAAQLRKIIVKNKQSNMEGGGRGSNAHLVIS